MDIVQQELNDQGLDKKVDIKKLSIEFSKRFIQLKLNIKNINKDIKTLKEDFNEQGLDTRIVVKSINGLLKARKRTQDELDTIDTFTDYLNEDQNFNDLVADLLAKLV